MWSCQTNLPTSVCVSVLIGVLLPSFVPTLPELRSPAGEPTVTNWRSKRLCAGEDLNLHGPYSPQGPQPCASTNSATGAWGAEYSPALIPSSGRASLRPHVRSRPRDAPHPEEPLMDLTKRQQEIFDFIKRYSADFGYPPTVRDIGKAVGLASSSTVHAHLANLEKLGLLRRDPSKPRAIEMLDRARGGVEQAVENVRSLVKPDGLPLVGQVAAGSAKPRGAD